MSGGASASPLDQAGAARSFSFAHYSHKGQVEASAWLRSKGCRRPASQQERLDVGVWLGRRDSNPNNVVQRRARNLVSCESLSVLRPDPGQERAVEGAPDGSFCGNLRSAPTDLSELSNGDEPFCWAACRVETTAWLEREPDQALVARRPRQAAANSRVTRGSRRNFESRVGFSSLPRLGRAAAVSFRVFIRPWNLRKPRLRVECPLQVRQR
jgi:hypothetical protein